MLNFLLKREKLQFLYGFNDSNRLFMGWIVDFKLILPL